MDENTRGCALHRGEEQQSVQYSKVLFPSVALYWAKQLWNLYYGLNPRRMNLSPHWPTCIILFIPLSMVLSNLVDKDGFHHRVWNMLSENGFFMIEKNLKIKIREWVLPNNAFLVRKFQHLNQLFGSQHMLLHRLHMCIHNILRLNLTQM